MVLRGQHFGKLFKKTEFKNQQISSELIQRGVCNFDGKSDYEIIIIYFRFHVDMY